MPMLPLEMPPGIVKQATEYANRGRWTDGNLIRWVNGKLQPVGGWFTVKTVAVTDPDTTPIRSIFSWVDKVRDRFSALGSHDRLFAYYGSAPNDQVSDITPLDFAPKPITGWGYGSDTYGTGRYGVRVPAPAELASYGVWSMDNYGEDLIACSSTDGRIFRWQRDTSPVVAATALPNAPIDNVGVIITDERFVVALGAGGDVRRIEWSDREDPELWAPTATNQAGGFNLNTSGAIVGGVRVRGGVLIITDTDIHLMRFIGGQLVYGFERLGTNCGAFSSQTIVAAYDMAFWMGQDRFWMFDGQVTRLKCEVLDFVFQRMNRNRTFAFTAGASAKFNEVWFFYPTQGDLNPTEYAAFSFRDEPHWHIGKLGRTAWHDNQVYNNPLASQPDGRFFLHETGYTDDNTPRLGDVFAETAPIDIAHGEKTSRVRRIFQDAFDPSGPPVFPYSLSLRLRPGADGDQTILGPFTIDSTRGYTDARGQGRSVQVKVESTEDEFWELGLLRLDLTPGGRRGY